MILETFLISATNTDVLSAGRLNAIPYNGLITLRFLADLGAAANHYLLTLQKPDGKVPVDAQAVYASGSGADMVMDTREMMEFKFAATMGGHFVVSLTLVGTATCCCTAILTP